MNLRALTVLAILIGTNAHADFVNIRCGNSATGDTVEFQSEEMSSLDAEYSSLVENGHSKKISRIGATRTEYGVLAIRVESGTGPGKRKYLFENLGSEKCFGVSGSDQYGKARLIVSNSLGVMNRMYCTCEND